MTNTLKKTTLSTLLKALLAAPIGQETSLYELASTCEGLSTSASDECVLVGGSDPEDALWFDDVTPDLAELAEKYGILLEDTGAGRFVPRQMLARGEFDLSQVASVRISRRVFGPAEGCRCITYANGRFEIRQGYDFEELLLSKASTEDQDYEVMSALEYAEVGSMRRWYYSNVDDADTWELLVTMRDGRVLASGGNLLWPNAFAGIFQSLLLAAMEAPMRDGDTERTQELLTELRIL